jgi:hypothetical protein
MRLTSGNSQYRSSRRHCQWYTGRELRWLSKRVQLYSVPSDTFGTNTINERHAQRITARADAADVFS